MLRKLKIILCVSVFKIMHISFIGKYEMLILYTFIKITSDIKYYDNSEHGAYF